MKTTQPERSRLVRFARTMLEMPVFAPVRLWLWIRVARRDSLGSRRIAESNGYLPLDYNKTLLAPDASSNTLFLLGSGSSVTELSDEKLATIGRNTSIGINAWAVHPFVPSFYSFETGQDGDGPSDETTFVTSLVQRSHVAASEPGFLFLRPTPPATPKNLVQPADELKSRSSMYGRANLVTQRARNLDRDIRRIVRASHRGKTPSNVLLDNGASIVRLMFLGGLQGFRRIVLVGIDLDSRPYFWDSPDYPHGNPELSAVLTRPSGQLHNSLETVDRPFPVDQVIVALSKVLKSELGVEVNIGSRSSALADRIPAYTWP